MEIMHYDDHDENISEAQIKYFELLRADTKANPDKIRTIDDYNKLKVRAGRETGCIHSIVEPINQVRLANGLEPL